MLVYAVAPQARQEHDSTIELKSKTPWAPMGSFACSLWLSTGLKFLASQV